MNILSNFIVTALAITLAGCAGGIRTFPNTLPKNMHVTTDVDGGKVEAAVAFDIHRMKKNCETEHEGRINLENGSIGVGLPSDEPLYLDFIFVSAQVSGLRSARHATARCSRLKAVTSTRPTCTTRRASTRSRSRKCAKARA